MAHHLPARLTVADDRAFGLKVGAAFAVLGGLVWWRGAPGVAAGLAALGGILMLGGLVAPAALRPAHRAWYGLAAVLSRVMTPIVLAILWYLILTPAGWLRRRLGGTPIARRPLEGSFWVAREPGRRQRRDLEHQF